MNVHHPAGAEHWTQRTPERIRRGAQSHAAKLTDDQIAALCELYRTHGSSRSWLARRFGVSRVTVWRHLKAAGLL